MQTCNYIKRLTPALAAAVVAIATTGTAVAAPAAQSTEPVYWWWDRDTPIGSAKLVRTPTGISATYHTSGLYAGHTMTLWFIVFNNPEACSTSPCSIPEDLENPDVIWDFLVAGGNVVGNGHWTTVGGHLQVGDNSGSGFPEIAPGVEGPGLTNPMGAEVQLALHSHGPKLSGEDLVSQISTYTGGCFNGFLPEDSGFAEGFEDVPADEGFCSTIQVSVHQP